MSDSTEAKRGLTARDLTRKIFSTASDGAERVCAIGPLADEQYDVIDVVRGPRGLTLILEPLSVQDSAGSAVDPAAVEAELRADQEQRVAALRAEVRREREQWVSALRAVEARADIDGLARRSGEEPYGSPPDGYAEHVVDTGIGAQVPTSAFDDETNAFEHHFPPAGERRGSIGQILADALLGTDEPAAQVAARLKREPDLTATLILLALLAKDARTH